jgi:type I restriction enzyme S subunit
MSTLPNGWKLVTIGDLAETALGKMLDRAKNRGRPQVPSLRNVNVQWGRIDTTDLLEMELDIADRDRFGVSEGDLLVCEGGEVGRAAIWRGGREYIAFQKALHRVRTRGELDLRYLRYVLEHYRNINALDQFTTGSTIAHLPQQELRRVPIPLAPLSEQRRIVDMLEDHLSRLDAAAASVAAARLRLQSLRRAQLDYWFGCTEPCVALSELADGVESGKSLGGSAPPARDDEWGIIKVSAMTWGEFRPEENKAIPSARADPRYEIRNGDLLVSRANTSEYVGASVLVGQVRPKLLLSDKSLRLKISDDVDPEWLWRVLQTPSARRQMSSLATGTKDSMRNISQRSLLSIVLPKIELDAQVAAVLAYRDTNASANRLHDTCASTQTYVNALRASLLEAAFSGRLTGHASGTEVIEEMAEV